MPHWRTLIESNVLRFVDLDGRDFVVRIAKVDRGKVTGAGGKQSGKGMIYFDGWPKPASAGAEFLTQIAAHLGADTRTWPGQWITIWPDPNVKYNKEKVGGVRCRSKLPTAEEIKAAEEGIARRKAQVAAQQQPEQEKAS